jgi:hypothetical protein
MTIQWSNNASGALASSISTASTTIVLAAGQGVEFPTPGGGNYFYATLTDTSNNLEVVKVTARVVDTLTVVRGQDGTAARSYAAGDLLELRPTAAALTDMQAYIPSGNITAGTIVGAISELDSEKAGLNLDNIFLEDNTFQKQIVASAGVLGNLSGNATTATSLVAGNFSISEEGGKLVIKNNSTIIASITASGYLVTAGNISSNDTP